MRPWALALPLLLLPACKGCAHPPEPVAGDEWPTGGRQGVLDGCVAKGQPRKTCECLAQRLPEQIPWRDFVAHQEDQAAKRPVNPATQAALDRVTRECLGPR